jgi:ABC-2 type transport system ATP-binding protein
MRDTATVEDQDFRAEAAAGPGSIRVRGLTRTFGNFVALAPLDLDVRPGMVTGLLGPNGSGKSTFMRTLIGLTPKSGGRAWLDGVELQGDGLAIRQRCTFAPGELSFYGHLRGRDQLAWLLDGRNEEAKTRAITLAESLGLPLRARIRTYSHGMKRQLLFSAALAPRVPVRILDEITEGLDPSKRGSVLELLREDAASGTTILLSSHHLAEVQRACDHMVFLRGGSKLAEENAEDVRRRSRRSVHLDFEDSTHAATFCARAQVEGVIDVQARDEKVTLQLSQEDPRAALVQLFSDSDSPRPVRMDYGELSLENLYQDLYGEDAC